jgi:hypothetical protein
VAAVDGQGCLDAVSDLQAARRPAVRPPFTSCPPSVTPGPPGTAVLAPSAVLGPRRFGTDRRAWSPPDSVDEASTKGGQSGWPDPRTHLPAHPTPPTATGTRPSLTHRPHCRKHPGPHRSRQVRRGSAAWSPFGLGRRGIDGGGRADWCLALPDRCRLGYPVGAGFFGVAVHPSPFSPERPGGHPVQG